MAKNADVTREKKACEACGFVRTVQVRRDVRRDYDVNKVLPEQYDPKDFVIKHCVECHSYSTHSNDCKYYVEPTVLSTTYHWEKLCDACDLRDRARRHENQAARFRKMADAIDAKRAGKDTQ